MVFTSFPLWQAITAQSPKPCWCLHHPEMQVSFFSQTLSSTKGRCLWFFCLLHSLWRFDFLSLRQPSRVKVVNGPVCLWFVAILPGCQIAQCGHIFPLSLMERQRDHPHTHSPGTSAGDRFSWFYLHEIVPKVLSPVFLHPWWKLCIGFCVATGTRRHCLPLWAAGSAECWRLHEMSSQGGQWKQWAEKSLIFPPGGASLPFTQVTFLSYQDQAWR